MKAAGVFAGALAACVATIAGAASDHLTGSTARVPQGKIVRYGVYHPPSKVRTATDRVPLILGRAFGIDFSVTGLPFERVEIVCRARHPQTVPGGEGVNGVNAFARRYVTRHGRLTEPYYRLRLWHEAMLIEGTWTLYCNYGDRILVSKDFFLFNPE